MRFTTPLAATAAALALVAAGCGSGSSESADTDPASLAPARAPVYVEATLKPDGELADDVKALSQKLAGVDDPGKALQEAFEKGVRDEDPDFSYEEDVKPWLGDEVGLFVTNIRASGLSAAGSSSSSSADADAAVIAPTKDVDKARETLSKALRTADKGKPAPKVVKKTYRDVDYELSQGEDTALAFVDDTALFGTDAGVRAAIDVSKGGEKLSDVDAFKQARDQVPDEKGLGFAYVRVSTLLSGLGPQGAAVQPLLGGLGETLALSLGGDEDQIDVDGASLGVRSEDAGSGPGSVLPSVAGDAWLAAGTADIGAQIDRSLQQIGQLGAFAGVDADQMLSQIERQTGLNLRRDLIDWMGDGAIFVRGSSLANIGGALVVESKDPAATRRAIPKLVRLVRGAARDVRVAALSRSGVRGFTLRSSQVPVPIHVGLADDRFVLAVGDAGLEGAASPSGALKDSAAYKDAQERLGSGLEPGFLLDVPPVAQLLKGLGLANDPEAKPVISAMDHLTTVSSGSRRQGDVSRWKVVVGVK